MKMDCKNCKNKIRKLEEKESVVKRLNVIEGQIRGIKQMVEEDRECDDVLIQISAVNKSLKSLGNKLLKTHLSTCVVHDIKNDNLDVLDDVMSLFGTLNK